MVTLRSILCPVDFSEQSMQTLRWAIAMASLQRSRLTLFTAVDPLLALAAKTRFHQDLTQAETEPLRELVTAASPAGTTPGVEVIVEARVGDAADAILEAADRHQADLIVMGTHGLSGVRKLLLGSTTDRVLRRVHTPVLVIPDGTASVDTTQIASNVKKIIAATDFSDTSIQAVRWAADFARHFVVPLVLLHVVRSVLVPTRWQPYVDLPDEEQTSEAHRRLETMLGDLPRDTRAEIVVTVGRAADEIASTAQKHGAGLIIMGLMGAGTVGAPRPGSIAYRVLSMAHVPVLVVPPDGTATERASRIT